MRYHYVWFDLGMTLVEPSRSSLYQKVLKEFQVDRTDTQIRKAYHLTDKLFMKEYPHVLGTDETCFMPWYIGNLNYFLDVRLNIIEVYQRFKEVRVKESTGWKRIPSAIGVLKELKRKGIKTGLISNWDRSCRKVLEENQLLDLLDTVVISSEMGVEKPEKEIFEAAFEQGNTSALESLYVGDNYYDDVIGAANVEMNCVLINPYGKEGIEEISHDKIISDISEVIRFVD